MRAGKLRMTSATLATLLMGTPGGVRPYANQRGGSANDVVAAKSMETKSNLRALATPAILLAGRAVFAFALVAGSSTDAHAGSGFELRSQSATTLGSAQAGMTASAEDITTIIFNPAALALGKGTEVGGGVTGLHTSVGFSGSASTILGTPIGGGQGGDAGTTVAIPNLFIGTDLSNSVRAGLAITPRFGLGSYWASGWIGRYYAVNSQLVTEDVVPTLSFKPSDAFSLGIGLDVQYARIKTTTAIDFGTIDAVLAGGAFGGTPAGSDGSVQNTADGWATGYVLGLLYEPRQGTRIGLDFHSQIRQHLQGQATFDTGGPVGAAIATTTGAFKNTDISADLTMPASVALGLYQELGRNWAVMFDAKWTQWSSLQTLQVTFANPAQAPVTTAFNWRNSWFFALGARYRVDDKWSIRFGAAYDQTPTVDDTRSPAIPDSDSYWLALGVQYHITSSLRLDFAYGHIFALNAPINLKATSPGNTFRGNLSGTVQDSNVDYLAAQITYRF